MRRPCRLLLVDDETLLLETMSRVLKGPRLNVRTAESGEAALKLLEEEPADVMLVDMAMPGMNGIELLRKVKAGRTPAEVIMMTAHGTIETAVEAMKIGAYDYLQKPAEVEEVERLVAKAYEKVYLVRENQQLRQQLVRHDPYQILIGESAPMSELRLLISKVAPTDATVLVLGESGVGKELVARTVQAQSQRADGPLLTVNCGALTGSLLANELFGHVAGAYTGATRTEKGLFEAAQGGTLFIDEIGEMGAELQRVFLRVLETGEYKRVGEARTRHADARIVAATNRDLGQDVAAGRFRQDLFYRLNVFSITVPPLRAHIEDLPALIAHLLRTLEPDREPRRLGPGVMAALREYPWPGNVRELKNALERGVIMATGNQDEITLADLPPLEQNEPQHSPEPAAAKAAPSQSQDQDDNAFVPLMDLEKGQMLKALELAERNKTEAARLLGISLRSLYTKMDRYKIPR